MKIWSFFNYIIWSSFCISSNTIKLPTVLIQMLFVTKWKLKMPINSLSCPETTSFKRVWFNLIFHTETKHVLVFLMDYVYIYYCFVWNYSDYFKKMIFVVLSICCICWIKQASCKWRYQCLSCVISYLPPLMRGNPVVHPYSCHWLMAANRPVNVQLSWWSHTLVTCRTNQNCFRSTTIGTCKVI